MLSTSRKLLTKVTFYNFFDPSISSPLSFLSIFLFKDQLLKARTSMIRRVRSVGKSSKPRQPQPLRSQSQSPHPRLATLPSSPPPPAAPPPLPPFVSSSTAALSKSPIPFDFSSPSSQPLPTSPSSSSANARNLHRPSLSASDADVFNQSSSENTYKGNVLQFFYFITPLIFFPFLLQRSIIESTYIDDKTCQKCGEIVFKTSSNSTSSISISIPLLSSGNITTTTTATTCFFSYRHPF